MQKISYQNLAESRGDFESLLDNFGLALQQGSWLDSAYSRVEELAKVYQDDTRRRKLLKKDNKDGDVYFSLCDVLLLYEVLPYIGSENPNLLRRKLKKILKTEAPHLESNTNNEARNTLWELKLFSRFKMVGIQASLGDPDPDVFVRVNRREYYIQCKRVFSPKVNALRNNIIHAVKQLNSDLSGKDSNSLGILAISLDRVLTDGKLMLVTDSEETARRKMTQALDRVMHNFGYLWQEPRLIQNQRIVGVILHLSAPGILEQENIFAPGTQMLFNNTWADGQGFHLPKKDFEALSKLL